MLFVAKWVDIESIMFCVKAWNRRLAANNCAHVESKKLRRDWCLSEKSGRQGGMGEADYYVLGCN